MEHQDFVDRLLILPPEPRGKVQSRLLMQTAATLGHHRVQHRHRSGLTNNLERCHRLQCHHVGLFQGLLVSKVAWGVMGVCFRVDCWEGAMVKKDQNSVASWMAGDMGK